MQPDTFELTRTVAKDECRWLPHDIEAGTIVHRFTGVTYGCISHSGIAVTLEAGGPFIELPHSALKPSGGE